MSPNPVRILVVDDHQLMLKGLQLQLEQAPGIKVIGGFPTGRQAMEFALRAPVDVAVVDLHLPDMTGTQLARTLIANDPRLRVVMLSSDAGIAAVKEALQAGVTGYVLKENTDHELLLAISEVMEGRPYLCPQINAAVLEDYKQTLVRNQGPPRPALSTREQEVLQLIAEGLRNKEIAARLAIGVKSVETYRRRLMEKLEINSTAELTRYAIREGMVRL